MPVYGYVRASTVEQKDTLTTQTRQIRGYALMQELTIKEVLIEAGVSGSTPFDNRPGGSRLMTILAKDDVLIASKLDRCFRSSLDALDVLARLNARGVTLHLIDMGGDVTANGMSKLIFTVLSAVAEAERDRLRERIHEIKQDQRAMGRYLGGKVPFGYRVGEGNVLLPIEEEQNAIRAMLGMRANDVSLRLISDEMKKRGFDVSHNAVREITDRFTVS
jgi:putative DNA-invertase from lambdoid prophage Rac